MSFKWIIINKYQRQILSQNSQDFDLVALLNFSKKALVGVYFFFKDFIYLFDRDRDSESGNTIGGVGTQQGEWEREKQASRGAGSPMRGSIPGPWDHDLS